MWIDSNRGDRGFTFIEVMVAMLIFVMASLAAISIAQGAVRASRDAKEMSVAVWLLQSKMVELETALETKGMDKACEKKKEGKFDAPFENFKWATFCYEVDFQLSAAASQLQQAAASGSEDSDENPKSENPLQKFIFNVVNDYIGKAIREIHVDVLWDQGKTTRTVALTSHFARYDQSLQIPALPGK